MGGVTNATPSPRPRADSVGLDGGDVSAGVGKLGDVSPRPVQQFPHPIGPVEEKVYSTLARVDEKGAPFAGFAGNSVWANRTNKLPACQTDSPIVYREWDVDPKIKGTPRNADRLVTGSDGSAYYTTDHYENFIMLRQQK